MKASFDEMNGASGVRRTTTGTAAGSRAAGRVDAGPSRRSRPAVPPRRHHLRRLRRRGGRAERLIPFDTIPRIIPKREWDELAKGLKQRVDALNRFLHDIYHGAGDPQGGRDPAEQVLKNPRLPEGDARRRPAEPRLLATSPASTWCAHADGKYYVLEDNLRTPSGVSYMIENRKMMMRLFPELFERQTRAAGGALPATAARDAARGGAAARRATRWSRC